jgi:hypothetical protein
MEYRDFGTELLYTKLLKVQNLIRCSKYIYGEIVLIMKGYIVDM